MSHLHIAEHSDGKESSTRAYKHLNPRHVCYLSTLLCLHNLRCLERKKDDLAKDISEAEKQFNTLQEKIAEAQKLLDKHELFHELLGSASGSKQESRAVKPEQSSRSMTVKQEFSSSLKRKAETDEVVDLMSDDETPKQAQDADHKLE